MTSGIPPIWRHCLYLQLCRWISKALLRLDAAFVRSHPKDAYTVRIDYALPKRPTIDVLNPQLELRPDQPTIPHTLLGNTLCVHTPGEWNSQMIIARTIVPWISTWLYTETDQNCALHGATACKCKDFIQL
jgi:hypothetical protein